MFVDLIQDGQTKTLGPFKKVYVEDVTLFADGKQLAFFNRDESFWSEDWTQDTAIDRFVIWA